jgi:capsular exopolysaccharide synthesis family protein
LTVQPTLVRSLRVIRERWWLLAVAFVVCTGATAVISLRATKQYTATATLLIQPSNLTTLVNPSQSTDSATQARQQSDYLFLLSSNAVAAIVKQATGSTLSVTDLQGKVDATAESNNDLIDVAVTDPEPGRASRLANGFANGLVSYLNNSDQSRIGSAETAILAQLKTVPVNSEQAHALDQALAQVTALRTVENNAVSVINPAQVPDSPSSASAKRNTAIGAVVGIVLGIALAFLFDLFDRRVKSADELERAYGMPTLATVPYARNRPSTEREKRIELEPFRILRDSLSYVSLRDPVRVVVVTSAVPEEGKTRVATGLARAAAATGRRIALIEADLHRPAVAGELGLARTGRGLTNALVEGKGVKSLMTSIVGSEALSVLLSGPLTPNSSELLRSDTMGNVLDELSSVYDLVIIDAPPLLPVADVHVLLDKRQVDVCVMVARPNQVSRDQIRSALAILRRHPEIGSGLVINAVRGGGEGPYDYSYAGASVNGKQDASTAPPRWDEERIET